MGYRNCLDYLEDWGAIPLTEAPFTEIDSLILSVCAYAPFEGILPDLAGGETLTLRAAVDRLTARPGWDHTGVVMADRIPQLVVRAAESSRFGLLPVGCFESVLEETPVVQFAALTWFLPDGTLALSYRGTDDSLVGWKECFSMAYAFPIPAQRLAAVYLEEVAARYPGKLRLCGHSKGGNLAVWAAVHAQPMTRGRVLRVDSHDGPGFPRDLTATVPYRALRHRIRVYVPQSSLVGALLHQDSRRTVIRSHGTGTVGQHDPFSWEVEGLSYRTQEKPSLWGRKSADAVRTWLTTMGPEELEEFVEVLFHLLSAGRARTLTDLTSDLPDSARAITRAFQALDGETRREVRSYLRRFWDSL